jgi:hypothetical protein
LPCVSRDHLLLERPELDRVTQEGIEEGVGLQTGQRVETELGIVGFVPPTVLVLRAIGDEEQEAGRRQALDEGVEARLRLGIQPVEVFQDHEQGLLLAGTEQELLDGLERLLAALRGIKGLPLGILDRHVQEYQDGRHQGCEGRIETQELGGDLVADRRGWIALSELEVVLEQVNDWHIGDRLVIGDSPSV